MPCPAPKIYSEDPEGFARGSSRGLGEREARSSGLFFNFVPVATPNDGVARTAADRSDVVARCRNIISARWAGVDFSISCQKDGLALSVSWKREDHASKIPTFLAEPMIRNTLLLLLFGSLLADLLPWWLAAGFDHPVLQGRRRWPTFLKGWMTLTVGAGTYKLRPRPRAQPSSPSPTSFASFSSPSLQARSLILSSDPVGSPTPLVRSPCAKPRSKGLRSTPIPSARTDRKSGPRDSFPENATSISFFYPPMKTENC